MPDENQSENRRDYPLWGLGAALVAVVFPIMWANSGPVSPEWWTVRWTALIVLVGILQLVMFYRQWSVMRRGLTETKDAVSAALDNAAAARAQADTLLNSERPYLYILPEGQLVYDATDGTVFIPYSVVNHGKSAAIVESVVVGLEPRRDALPPEGLNFGPEHRLFMRRVIAPGEEIRNLEARPPGNVPFDITRQGTPILRAGDDEETFLKIQILYRGPFTRGHDTLITWRHDELTNQFLEAMGWDNNFNHVR